MALFKTSEETFQCIPLMEAYNGITVTALNANNDGSDTSHARTIANETLVSPLGVIFLSLKKPTVQIKVLRCIGVKL